METSAPRTCTHAVPFTSLPLSAPSTSHPSPQACSTPPSAYPFHELDNVVMTPHVGGGLGEPRIETARADAITAVLRVLTNGS